MLIFCYIFLTTHQDACQTLLKRLQPIINKNPKGTWNDWVRHVNPTKCVCVLAETVIYML